jgi:hypothetical protein
MLLLSLKRIGGDWRRIYWDDPFHTVINTRTSRIITGIFVAVRFDCHAPG